MYVVPAVKLPSACEVAFAEGVATWAKSPSVTFLSITKPVSLLEASVQAKFTVLLPSFVAENPVGAAGALAPADEVDPVTSLVSAPVVEPFIHANLNP